MYRKASSENLSRSQFDAARLGFFQLLRRKRISPQFTDRHGEDLFAQACFEYSRRRAEGIEIANPPAWIVTCAWHRTVSQFETRDHRPEMVSTERFGEFPGQEATPDEDILGEDRLRKVREAVDLLPDHQRRLLALSYFEDESIREAARRLGWTPSKAQRAHEAAQRRLFKLLGVQTSDELEIIGLAAFLSVAGGGGARHLRLPAGVEGAVEFVTRHATHLGERALALIRRPVEAASHPTRLLGRSAGSAAERSDEIGGPGPLRRIGDLGRRLVTGGAGEAGSALAGEGGTRALEICKGLTVCVIGGGALTGALVGGGHHPARPVDHGHRQERIVRSAPSGPERAAVTKTVVPSGPRSRAGSENPAATGPAEKTVSASKTPKVDDAQPAEETKVVRRTNEEASTEAQFRDFAATEGSADSTAAAQSRPVTDAATTSEVHGAGTEASPQRKTEEAQAAKEFHGLLE
jgi:RNA polymerase sigma factor (sigma-70 family)